MTETDVLILGAGAAGLMCAIHAGRRRRRVLVIEHADRPGKKILISGGGRCNFTNLHARAESYISQNPHFARSALARYTPQDFLTLVDSHAIPWHEKTLGQLFCDRSAHDILNLLMAECAAAEVRLQLSTRVVSVAQTSTLAARFRVETSAGPVLAHSVVVATGGLSIPKIGATALGYDIARQFYHPIIEPRPALVPLLFSPAEQARWCDLAGISAEVIATVSAVESQKQAGESRGKTRSGSPAFREKMLFTHRGLSGPAILQVSSYWHPGHTVQIDLAPTHPPVAGFAPYPTSDGVDRPVLSPIFSGLNEPRRRRDPSAVSDVLRSVLPSRLVTRWLESYASHTIKHPHAPISNTKLAEMDRQLHTWRVVPAGTEGFAKAEVTAGGVSTDALNARTLESRLVPGLYFIGEVVDVTGWLGGYNFQWAWASGVAAGSSA